MFDTMKTKTNWNFQVGTMVPTRKHSAPVEVETDDDSDMEINFNFDTNQTVVNNLDQDDEAILKAVDMAIPDETVDTDDEPEVIPGISAMLKMGHNVVDTLGEPDGIDKLAQNDEAITDGFIVGRILGTVDKVFTGNLIIFDNEIMRYDELKNNPHIDEFARTAKINGYEIRDRFEFIKATITSSELHTLNAAKDTVRYVKTIDGVEYVVAPDARGLMYLPLDLFMGHCEGDEVRFKVKLPVRKILTKDPKSEGKVRRLDTSEFTKAGGELYDIITLALKVSVAK